MDLELYSCWTGWETTLASQQLRLSALSAGLLQDCCRTAFLHTHSIEQCGKEDASSANSTFGVLSSMVPYQLALHIQLYSSCLCQSWEGAEEVILPLSLVSVKQLAAEFCCQEKCSVILQSCCPFPRISPALTILDRPQQPPPGSILHQATSVGPDSVFPLFTAEQHCFSRVRALHICTESNRMWSTCSDGAKLFEGVS